MHYFDLIFLGDILLYIGPTISDFDTYLYGDASIVSAFLGSPVPASAKQLTVTSHNEREKPKAVTFNYFAFIYSLQLATKMFLDVM